MSRKYKMRNPQGIYFISFAVVNWVDVFIREDYFEILVESLNYCIRSKGMELYCYVIMTNHVHMIFSDRNKNPSKLLKEFKTFTSKALRKAVQYNPKESRKKWMINIFREEGLRRSNVKYYQFWQQHNHPIELYSNYLIDQKVNYVHNNPVKAGFVIKPEHWKYSSAGDYAGIPGLVNLTLI